MKAYTFFTAIPGVDQAFERRLMVEWEKNWKAHGFEPIVLSQNDVRRSPHWFTGTALFRSLKGGRLDGRSLACFQRWLAYDAVARHHNSTPTLMMDYDVRNNGFTPADVSKEAVMFYDSGHLPSVVSTALGGSQQLVQTVLGTVKIAKEAFIEDSVMFQRNRKHYKAIDVVKDAGAPGWQEAKLIHYYLGGPIPRP